jgi:hypothetical protein
VIQKELNRSSVIFGWRFAAIAVQVHRLYNPEGLTHYNVVPGLMGVIHTMTMVMMTGLAITRERERGTMENMLAMPSHAPRSHDGKAGSLTSASGSSNPHHPIGCPVYVSCALLWKCRRDLPGGTAVCCGEPDGLA